MGPSLLIGFFVIDCMRLTNARFLSIRKPTQGVELQKLAGIQSEWKHSRASVQPGNRLWPEQIQPTVGPLSWRFPKDPVDPVLSFPAKFEVRRPVTTNHVAVRCGENSLQVEVSQDLFSFGKLIKPEEITLGGCSATDSDDLSHVLVFESELHGCGSTLVLTDNDFIYAFTLVYKPKLLKIGIIRNQGVAIGVECHYPR